MLEYPCRREKKNNVNKVSLLREPPSSRLFSLVSLVPILPHLLFTVPFHLCRPVPPNHCSWRGFNVAWLESSRLFNSSSLSFLSRLPLLSSYSCPSSSALLYRSKLASSPVLSLLLSLSFTLPCLDLPTCPYPPPPSRLFRIVCLLLACQKVVLVNGFLLPRCRAQRFMEPCAWAPPHDEQSS